MLSLSNDGIIIIAEVNRDAEDQKKKKTLWAREYYISNDCLKANLENKNFKDVTKQTDYKDGKIDYRTIHQFIVDMEEEIDFNTNSK